MSKKKKKSKEEKPINNPQEKYINLPKTLMKTIFHDWKYDHIRDQFGSPPGPTKSWVIHASFPCIYRKLPKYPQLTFSSPIHGSCDHQFPNWNKIWSLRNENIMTVPIRTYIRTSWNNMRTSRVIESRSMKHEITEMDPYGDEENKVMNFTCVVACDEKVYALSSQGCLVVMEEKKEVQMLVITGKCRAVPSCSMNAKYFDEYLFESRGGVFLVFLICRERTGPVDEVEVFKVVSSHDIFELVKVGGLGGRALFLEKRYVCGLIRRKSGVRMIVSTSSELICSGCMMWGLDQFQDG